jgi:hypothetical protein
MSTIATPPAESQAPVVPVAPVETPAPVEPNGTEGQESITKEPEAGAPAADAQSPESTEPAGQEVAPAPVEEADPFLEESTLPAEQVTKIKAAFGDEALGVVAKLEQVQSLEQTFGEIPSVEYIQQLGQGQQAIDELFKALDTQPEKALEYFLLDEKGGLDDKGAQFIGALSEGVRRGTIPVEARIQLAQATFTSALVDVDRDLVELDREIKFAQQNGRDAKVNELQLQMGEQEIIRDYLKKFLGVKIPARKAPAAQDPARAELEKEKAEFEKQKQVQAQQAVAAIETQQVAKYQSIVDQEIAKFTSQIPATVPAYLKEAAVQGARLKLDAAVAAAEKIKTFNKFHQTAIQLAATKTPGYIEALDKAKNAYKNILQITASQVYGPMLKEMGVVVSEKSQSVLDARTAGAQKLDVPPVANTTSGAATAQDMSDWGIRKGESAKDYMNRMAEISKARGAR